MTRRRYTDADKWDDAWYYGLTPAAKLLFGYLCDRCDLVGVWKVNRRQAANAIGMELDWDALLLELGERVADIGKDRWLLTGFFRFQYPKGIGTRSVPHRAIRNALRSHGLLDQFASSLIEDQAEPTPMVGQGLPNPWPTNKDKDSPSRDIRNRGGEKPPEVSGDTRARVEAGAPDPNDLTTPKAGDPPAAVLRLVDRTVGIGVLDELRFAGARIQRDDQGTWLKAVQVHGIERVLDVLHALTTAKQPAWWSTVKAWLDGKSGAGSPGQPNDGWHYPPQVLFDAQGPHIIDDGERIPFTPTKRLADVQREREAR